MVIDSIFMSVQTNNIKFRLTFCMPFFISLSYCYHFTKHQIGNCLKTKQTSFLPKYERHWFRLHTLEPCYPGCNPNSAIHRYMVWWGKTPQYQITDNNIIGNPSPVALPYISPSLLHYFLAEWQRPFVALIKM